MSKTLISAANDDETSEGIQPLLYNASWLIGIQPAPDYAISVLFCVIMVALGSVQFGFSFGYSSPTQTQIMEDLGLTVAEFSLFGSLVNVGAMAGAIASSQTQSKSAKFGRRGSLMIATVPNILGWIFISFTTEASLLYVGRLLLGFGIGIISYTVPIYISEIAPEDSRGSLGSISQLGITAGFVLVYLFGTFLDWRTLAVIGILPSLALLPGLFFVPESPWWLAKKGLEYRYSLQCLRGYDTDVSSEFEEIQRSVLVANASSAELWQKRYAVPLMLAVGLLMLQQLSGINALLFYSSYIFEHAGIADGNLATLGLGVVQVFATAVATWLIDKAGRRVLLMVSASGMTLSLLLAAAAFYLKGTMSSSSNYYNTICILSFAGIVGMVIFYSVGVGLVPWLIMSEILPIEIKNYAGNIATLAKFLTAWVITMTSILLFSWSKTGTFSIYAAFSALTLIFASLWLPETKGKTLEEIQTFFS